MPERRETIMPIPEYIPAPDNEPWEAPEKEPAKEPVKEPEKVPAGRCEHGFPTRNYSDPPQAGRGTELPERRETIMPIPEYIPAPDNEPWEEPSKEPVKEPVKEPEKVPAGFFGKRSKRAPKPLIDW